MPNYGGFSWNRLLGISRMKSQLSRSIGIPLTRSGRQRKLGKMMGFSIPFSILLIAGVALVVLR